MTRRCDGDVTLRRDFALSRHNRQPWKQLVLQYGEDFIGAGLLHVGGTSADVISAAASVGGAPLPATSTSPLLYGSTDLGPSPTAIPSCNEGSTTPDLRLDVAAPLLKHGRSVSHNDPVVQRNSVHEQRRKSKIGNWSNVALKSTIVVVEAGGRVKTIARYFDIPPNSLYDHLYSRILGRKRIPPTILN
jgi:hypothetical protein